MQTGEALDLSKKFASVYYQYCKYLTPNNHETLYHRMVNSKIEATMQHIRDNEIVDIARYIYEITDEYRRLNEYHERFGVVVLPTERRPGNRILP